MEDININLIFDKKCPYCGKKLILYNVNNDYKLTKTYYEQRQDLWLCKACKTKLNSNPASLIFDSTVMFL